MNDLERVQIQCRETSENIKRVTKEVIIMEELLKEVEDEILGLGFEMVAEDSDRWQSIAEKAHKFRERIFHLKSERRRFIRIEKVYNSQIRQMEVEEFKERAEQEELKNLEEKKQKLAQEIKAMKKDRLDAENILEKLNRQRKERSDKIKQAAMEEKVAVSEQKEVVQERPVRRRIRTIKDLVSLYSEIDKKEEEKIESEVDIEFSPPRPLKNFKFSIDKFDVKDLKEIIDIETYSFPRPWRRYMFYKEMEIPVSHHFILKASDSSGEFIMAYCIFWATKGKMNILNFAVHPSYRMQEIGTRFLKAMLNKAKFLGAGHSRIILRESNVAGQELFKKIDFEQTEVKKDYFGFKSENAIVMEKDIKL